MRVYKVDSVEPVVSYITEAIRCKQGQGHGVVWLVSGGSVIPVAVEIRRRLGTPKNLTVGLIDERYGVPGHMDSNWTQLLAAGFDMNNVVALPTLSGKSFEETTSDYGKQLSNALASSDYSLGLFGMGTDGHTSGILPGSPATEETDKLVIGYRGPDYLRITTTATAIKQLDEAVLYAIGVAKHLALSSLIATELPISRQPVQVLKAIKSFTIYNDYKGEPL